jgi:hypothetical protein
MLARSKNGRRSFLAEAAALIVADFRYWPSADIPSCAAHVRFRGRYWGQSGHALLRCVSPLVTQSGHAGLVKLISKPERGGVRLKRKVIGYG